VDRLKDSLKHLVVPGMLFEELGFRYFGPVNGHDIPAIMRNLEAAKRHDGPTLIHILTQKGKGYQPAELEPSKFHGVGPFNSTTGTLSSSTKKPTYSEVFGHTMVRLGFLDSRLVAITAAMPDGTGLLEFSSKFPERCFDVGIAEQHAVTFASALASSRMRPVFAVYSTFSPARLRSNRS
jgi:1-deoxy-D-xylulose-5-phosphate synthase